MTFDEFAAELAGLAKKHGMRADADPETGSAVVYGPKYGALARARHGLAGIEALAEQTAEHHPYWNVISQCSQICSAALDSWDGKISEEDAERIRWSVRELENACAKL